MNRAPFFNEQFSVVDAEGRLVPAASYRLFTYAAGTTTEEQATYQDQAGENPNTNPIILDAEGRCNLWLDPSLEYLMELREPVDMGGAQVWVRDDVVGSAETTNTVLSVNGLTGDVVLTADDIDFTSSAGLDWFDAADAGAALDQLADRANAPEASTVTVADAGGYFPDSDTVEEVLQEIGEALGGGVAGRFLRLKVVTASEIWTVPDDVGSILVRMVGGGGGGWGGAFAGNGGGGGGAGGFCEKHINGPTSPITITIGAGGAAGTDGGDTVFGAYMTAGGGKGSSGTGGEGGTCTGGDLNLKGGGGGGGTEADGNRVFGIGGSSYFGGAARGVGEGGSGTAGAPNTGGGGSGGLAPGAGGSGLVMIYMYT